MVFNINIFEIQTIYKTGLICCSIPFNKEKITNDNYYKYFIIIIFENNTFYCKIYHILKEYIEETEKIILKQNYHIFLRLVKAKDILNYYINRLIYNKKEEIIKVKDISFSISYKLKKNGIINLKINFINSRQYQIFNILMKDMDLNKIKFI